MKSLQEMEMEVCIRALPSFAKNSEEQRRRNCWGGVMQAGSGRAGRAEAASWWVQLQARCR